jgi:hypothetical protein
MQDIVNAVGCCVAVADWRCAASAKLANAQYQAYSGSQEAYLVLGGMQMFFRVLVGWILPASASTAAKLGSLGGDELA